MTYSEFKDILSKKNLTISQFLKDCEYNKTSAGYWRRLDRMPAKAERLLNNWLRGK